MSTNGQRYVYACLRAGVYANLGFCFISLTFCTVHVLRYHWNCTFMDLFFSLIDVLQHCFLAQQSCLLSWRCPTQWSCLWAWPCLMQCSCLWAWHSLTQWSILRHNVDRHGDFVCKNNVVNAMVSSTSRTLSDTVVIVYGRVVVWQSALFYWNNSVTTVIRSTSTTEFI